MAGESSEFRRASERMRRAHLAELDKLGRSIRENQARFQWISAAISLVTILLGLLASSWMRGVVVDPLRRITATLTRLARGERGVSIPDRDRGDEVGAIAQAAQVFAERNRETAAMLDEIRELADRHERTIVDLEASNRELDNFAHIASHDLKAPLRAMALLTEWIEEDGGDQLSGPVREHLVTLRNRVARMARLLEDLLAYSKAGRSELDEEVVDVETAVHDAIEMASVPTGFDVRIAGESAELWTARVAFVQVVQNLVSNAARHHDRESGQIMVEIRAAGEAVEVAVTDDGPGIAPKYHQRIFEPFETLRRRDVAESSGVGLALVKRLLERCGASISVESDGGRGATFRVRWPLHRVAQ